MHTTHQTRSHFNGNKMEVLYYEVLILCVLTLYRKAILRRWKELNDVEATYGKLLMLCCENDIQSIAEAICIMLKSRQHSEF